MLAVVDMVHSALGVAGVIIESEPIAESSQLRRACHLAERAGADYVVTGTGAATARTTIRRALGPPPRQRRPAGRGQGRRPAPHIDELREAAEAGAARPSPPASAPSWRGSRRRSRSERPQPPWHS